MATKYQRMQRIIRHFKDQTGKKEVEMPEVAKWAANKGWPLPTPPSAIDLLAKDFSAAARMEVRKDKATGLPYRANHAVNFNKRGHQATFWVDIDEAPRKHIHKSLTQRREQMVGDGLSLIQDAEHWNRTHPDDQPINMELDFGPDIEWRRNGPSEKTG